MKRNVFVKPDKQRELVHSVVARKGRIKYNLLLIIVLFALAGCMRSRLLQVERLMETDFEVADSLIYSMDEPADKRNRAIYAMLKTQIDYKQYRDIPNDSLIRIATDYYGKKYKNYHAAMAWYSLGCVSGLNGQDSTAADAYLTALALFPDTMVRYYALAEQNLSYIYLNHNMDAEATQLIKACRTNAVRLKDSAAIAICDYNIANFLLYDDNYSAASVLFAELKDNKWLSADTKDIPFIQLAKIAQIEENNYNESLALIDSFFIRSHHIVPCGVAYSVKADAYYGLNQLDSARLYYALSLTEATDAYTVCDAYRRLSEIQSIKNNRDSATYYAKLASAWMDTIAAANSSSVIFRIINKYSASSFNPKNKHHTFFAVFLTICFLISGFLFIYHKRIHKKTESIADFADDIVEFRNSSLYLEMVNVVHNQEELSTKNKNLFEKNFRKSLIGLREFIIKSSTQMSSIEIDYCIYTILGFRQKDFVLFYNISPSGSRNIKARIKDKTPEQLFNNIFS